MTIDLAKIALRRSDAYRLLAACFYEPDREMFIEENLCLNLAELMAEISPPLAEACRRMDASLKENSQEALLVDYSALFLGPFKAPAQPYGSVYLEQERRLMGDSTMDVQKVYAEAGVKQEADDGPPDHIAIELEFMSFLEGKIIQANSEGNQADQADYAAIQARFFNHLLASWAPALGKALVHYADLEFYRSLGQCLIDFIAAEQQRLVTNSPANP